MNKTTTARERLTQAQSWRDGMTIQEQELVLTALKTQEKLENGWVLVPVEPTDEIITRMVQEWTSFAKVSAPSLIMWKAVYKAMITQAQENEE